MTANSSTDSVQSWNIHEVGHTDLGGHGDCMHVNVVGDYAFVGHMGGDRVGTSIVDVSDISDPRVVAQIETPVGTHSHKVQVVDDLLLVNHEKNPAEPASTEWSAGLKLYDVSNPRCPKEVGFFATPGKGVHRMTYWEPPYAWMSGSGAGYLDQFLIVADLSDPANPVEVGRWSYPGMNVGAGEVRTWPEDRRYANHHALIRGNRAYATWWDAGLMILDVSDVTDPRLVKHLPFDSAVSGATHTAMPLPGREILIVTDECVEDVGTGIQKHVRVVDISDETNPTVLSTFPVPNGDFAIPGGRFGPHNIHEMRPGSYQSSSRIHLTYFSAGLRIVDVADPLAPREVAYYVPAAAPGASSIQLNDLTVTADGTIFVTDRAGGGLYILQDDLPTNG